MKAIKIPNTALLDVFGRPVAINSHEFHRLSHSDPNEKAVPNTHNETRGKDSIANGVPPNPNTAPRLTVIGETPLHIAVFFNDIASVELLVKHGVDVNQRIVGDFYPNGQPRSKDETRIGRQSRARRFFRRHDSTNKPISLKNASPESKPIDLLVRCCDSRCSSRLLRRVSAGLRCGVRLQRNLRLPHRSWCRSGPAGLVRQYRSAHARHP